MLFPTLDEPSRKLAVRIGDSTLTYADLARRARAHAAGLIDRGLAPGDRVLVSARPNVATVVTLVGNALAGVVSVPVDPDRGDDDRLALAAQTDARLCIGESSRIGNVATADRPFEGDAARAPAPPGRDAPVVVLSTSGTTGAPKGAVHTVASVAFTLDALASAWKLTADDTLVHALPLFHAHGLVFGVFGALRIGAAVRVLPRFEATEVAFAIHGQASSVLYASPAQLQAIAERAEADRSIAAAVARARLLVTGSAPFPARERRRLERSTGQIAVERYGVTESLINAAMRVGEVHRPGTVGRALEGVSLRLVDDARRPRVAHDGASIGEIAVAGPNVFDGYCNRPAATAAVRDEAGWFYTGDLGVVGVDGEVRIVGRRATDLIRTADGLVAAGEVEAALLEHPDVREAAVVSVGNEGDDRIVAFVAPRAAADLTAMSLRAHAEASLPRHKRPGRIALVPALPRNAIGKVMKAQLRARAIGGVS